MADCERALDHPEKAIELSRSAEADELDPEACDRAEHRRRRRPGRPRSDRCRPGASRAARAGQGGGAPAPGLRLRGSAAEGRSRPGGAELVHPVGGRRRRRGDRRPRAGRRTSAMTERSGPDSAAATPTGDPATGRTTTPWSVAAPTTTASATTSPTSTAPTTMAPNDATPTRRTAMPAPTTTVAGRQQHSRRQPPELTTARVRSIPTMIRSSPARGRRPYRT